MKILHKEEFLRKKYFVSPPVVSPDHSFGSDIS